MLGEMKAKRGENRARIVEYFRNVLKLVNNFRGSAPIETLFETVGLFSLKHSQKSKIEKRAKLTNLS